MFSHVTVGSNDVVKAKAFYDGSGPYGTTPTYNASFFDEDDVRVSRVPFTWEGTFKKGQRVRATLKLPGDEVVKKTKTVRLLAE